MSRSKTSKFASNLWLHGLSLRHTGAAVLTSRTTRAQLLLSGLTEEEAPPSRPTVALLGCILLPVASLGIAYATAFTG